MTTRSRLAHFIGRQIFFIVAAFITAQAAEFSDHLLSTLQSRNPAEFTSVLVFMTEQLNTAELSRQQKLSTVTRQASHEYLVNELRSFATDKQADFKEYLEQARLAGKVESFESYWIANAFQVKASKDFIEELGNRADIEAIIEDLPPTALYNPNQKQTIVESAAGVSENLRTIGADDMWAMGYTGVGRLIATFDTGVDGTHPALSSSWRGNTHSAAESWFDPVFGESAPHIDSSLGSVFSHGTSTLGVIVGKNDASGDTVGVAFDAEWISAMITDVPGANYIEAFQWVADPDGNPGTVGDVPDVLSNSWGFPRSNLNCSQIFWAPIDNLEELGTVVIFACGNEGPGAMTIRNPANRSSGPHNTFSVGATLADGSSVWGGSSRGPSDCDSISIKPEVVAPGVAIRTPAAMTPNGYTLVTGTSFAAPHVAGAVALLRQYNPNATVNQIKSALLNSAVDMGDVGDDNVSGNGLINIPAALALMPANSTVNVFVQSIEHNPISSGMTVPFTVTLKNSGVGVLNVSAQLVNPQTGISIQNGSSSFGDLSNGASSVNSGDPYVIRFDNLIPNGTRLTVDLSITGSSGYQKTTTLFFTVGEALIKSSYTHSSDSVEFTISNYGTYGLAPGSTIDRNGEGFLFPNGGINNLFQSALLIGNSSLGVSDGMSNTIFSVDADFRVAPGGNLQVASGGSLGDHETFSRFNDADAAKPLGISVEQRTASFNGAADANYVILEYVITNDQDTAINSLYVGIYCDWDFPPGSGSDRTNFNRSANLGYMWYNNNPQYRGTSVLNPEGVSTYFAIPNSIWIYDGVSDAAKFEFLTHGIVDTANSGAPDQSYCISTGPFNLQPGSSDTAAFAMVAGRTASQLATYANRAKSIYRQATPVNDDEDVILPRAFQLDQNYPNPFNPVTRIDFSLQRAGPIRLEVFNALGQKVATLIDDARPAGAHSVFWNGANDQGESVSSGIYFYKLSSGDFTETRKMILVK